VKVYYKPSINNKILDVIAEADRLGKTIEKITVTSEEHTQLMRELSPWATSARARAPYNTVYGVKLDVEN
jgi:hypothetical protein